MEGSERRLRLAERLRRDGCDGMADVARLVRQLLEVVGADHCANARLRGGGFELELCYTRARVRRAEDGRVQHPGQLQVGRVEDLPPDPVGSIDARHLPPDDRQGSLRPRVDRVLVDDDPDVLVAAFDFLLGLDQPCQVAIASSIFG